MPARKKKRNPDENIRKLKKLAMSSNNDDDIWAYIVAAKRAGQITNPERPRYPIIDTKYGKLEIQPFNNHKVILSGKNIILPTYTDRKSSLNFEQVWSWVTDPKGSLPRDEWTHDWGQEASETLWESLLSTPTWVPYRRTEKVDRWGNDIYQANFIFSVTNTSLILSADNLPTVSTLLLAFSHIIQSWMTKHEKEIDLSVTLSYLENIAEQFKEYDKLNTQTEIVRNRIVASAKEWLEAEKTIKLWNRKNPSDDRLRKLKRSGEDPVRELLEKERTGLISSRAVKMAAMLQHPIASQIYPELASRFTIDIYQVIREHGIQNVVNHYTEVFSEMLPYLETNKNLYIAIWNQINPLYQHLRRFVDDNTALGLLPEEFNLLTVCIPILEEMRNKLKKPAVTTIKKVLSPSKLKTLLTNLELWIDVPGALEDEEIYQQIQNRYGSNLWDTTGAIHDFILAMDPEQEDDYVEMGRHLFSALNSLATAEVSHNEGSAFLSSFSWRYNSYTNPAWAHAVAEMLAQLADDILKPCSFQRNPDATLRKLTKTREDSTRLLLENYRRGFISPTRIRAAAILGQPEALEIMPEFTTNKAISVVELLSYAIETILCSNYIEDVKWLLTWIWNEIKQARDWFTLTVVIPELENYPYLDINTILSCLPQFLDEREAEPWAGEWGSYPLNRGNNLLTLQMGALRIADEIRSVNQAGPSYNQEYYFEIGNFFSALHMLARHYRTDLSITRQNRNLKRALGEEKGTGISYLFARSLGLTSHTTGTYILNALGEALITR